MPASTGSRGRTFDGWRAKAPAGFRYAVKVNRFITHMKKLLDCPDAVAEFIGLARRLGASAPSSISFRRA